MSVNGNAEYVPSPRPHPRIKPEAQSYAERNRLGSEKWYDYSDVTTTDYSSVKPGSRIRTEEAQKIADTNKGSMSELMGGYPDPAIQRQIHPRGVNPDAAGIAESNKGGGMKNLMDNYGNLGISDRPAPKVKGGEAEEYAERNHGTLDTLINNSSGAPEPAPPVKLDEAGSEVAAKHTGADMGPLLRMEGDLQPQEVKISKLHQQSEGGWDEVPPHHRTRPEAEVIANKNSVDSMSDILAMNPASQRVTKNKVLSHLESEDARPPSSGLRTRPETVKYHQRNQNSEMEAIMHGESNQAPVRVNRSNRMMQRSEDW